MAVNSFREDEQMKNTQKKQIILRLFSYMNISLQYLVYCAAWV